MVQDTPVLKRHIEEHVVEGRRLGRHIVHDPKSKEYEAEQAPSIQDASHPFWRRPLDQGDLGSCTGNAAGGLLMTTPWYKPERKIDESICVMIYETATRLDPWRGYYPPTDTGSSGLAVCKAMKNAGMIPAYRHTFSLDAALRALSLKPGITGIPWMDSFDEPDGDGFLVISPNAGIRGGHELLVTDLFVDNTWVGGPNSWGPQWGPLEGFWRMKWDTWGQLLAMQGDFTIPG